MNAIEQGVTQIIELLKRLPLTPPNDLDPTAMYYDPVGDKFVDMKKTFNVLELASELADLKLRETFNGDVDLVKHNPEGIGIPCGTPSRYLGYTEEAQEYFNELCDEYYDFLINL